MNKFFKGIWILTKKELKVGFGTPLVYAVTALFCALIGWLFFNYLVLAKNLTTKTFSQAVFYPLFGNMNFVFLIFIPILTMRSFAEEKKEGTLNLLFLSQLSNLQIILGKLLGLFVTCLFILSFTLVFPVIVSFSGPIQWGEIFSGYLGLFGSLICYITIGMFFSSISKNPILSAILTFCALMGLLLLVVSTNIIQNEMLSQMIQYLSISFHFEGFIRGGIKSYNLIYFITFPLLLIYMTKNSLNSRNW